MISNDKNQLSEIVVRQQRNKQLPPPPTTTTNTTSNLNGLTNKQAKPTREDASSSLQFFGSSSSTDGSQKQMFDQNGLVLPRKIPHKQMPAPLSGQQPTAIRDLTRELKFNQISGKNVLDQKSELKKAMEKLDANKRKREAESERLRRRTSLELLLEERAARIARESASGPERSTSACESKPSPSGSSGQTTAISFNSVLKSTLRWWTDHQVVGTLEQVCD